LLEMTMNKQLTLMKALTVAAIAVGSMSTANAAIFFRSRVVVAPVVAPVAVAPVAPVVAAPVVAAPVVSAPAVAPPVVAPVVTPVYVPTCRLVSVPVVNAITGVTFLVPRRVCN
jgi:2-oxoglutarate dehydrogenase E2 component (dihydrolipoamide succinyltransferase)